MKRIVLGMMSGALAFAAIAMVGGARAQEYPTKSVRVLVPFPPGGGSDLIARLVSQKLAMALGQPTVVENRAGASGNIAAEIVARSPADGYTLLFGNSSLSISPAVYRKLNYSPTRDLVPISMASSYPFALTVHPSLPVRTVKDLVALAKAKPDQLAYSSAGAGTMSHMAMELLRVQTGIQVQHLPYKGAAPASVALISGEAQLAFLVMPVAQVQMKAGKLRGLGVAAPARSSAAPDLPTMQEAGVAGHIALQWNGFFAPAKTPPAVLDRLHREVAKAVHLPDVKARFEAEGATPAGTSPSEFAAFYRAEAEKWADVAKRSGTRLD
ncbi:MAG TPA: tripartite tricarboxylate transporter substrate binding protein [Burkholderiales bacterium]|nr:tripartite tricarboxylate transporter substrate binding protein [Burkholderiales bacterium]